MKNVKELMYRFSDNIQNKISRNIILKKGVRADEMLPSFFYKYQFLKNIIIDIDVYALLRSQYWSREEIKKIQFERIKNIVTHANNIPFWQEHFKIAKINPTTSFTWEDFYHIPVTSKKDFKNISVEYITDQKIFKTGHFPGATSGSTGEPFNFFLDKYFDMRSIAICQRMFMSTSKNILLPMIHIRAKPRYGFAHKKSTMFFVYDYNHMKYRIDKLFNEIKKIDGPYILYGFSSYILEIAKLCHEKKIYIHPLNVLTTGESIASQEKQYIESNLKTKVFNAYATNELGWLTQECEHGNLHINNEYVYIEIIDEEGSHIENNKDGRVIVTSFDHKIMPFIRYDTGDIGTISNEFCKCGRTSPHVKITGRKIDMINLPSGRQIPFLNLLNVFNQYSDFVYQFQIIQKKINEFTVKIIPLKKNTRQHSFEDASSFI